MNKYRQLTTIGEWTSIGLPIPGYEDLEPAEAQKIDGLYEGLLSLNQSFEPEKVLEELVKMGKMPPEIAVVLKDQLLKLIHNVRGQLKLDEDQRALMQEAFAVQNRTAIIEFLNNNAQTVQTVIAVKNGLPEILKITGQVMSSMDITGWSSADLLGALISIEEANRLSKNLIDKEISRRVAEHFSNILYFHESSLAGEGRYLQIKRETGEFVKAIKDVAAMVDKYLAEAFPEIKFYETKAGLSGINISMHLTQ